MPSNNSSLHWKNNTCSRCELAKSKDYSQVVVATSCPGGRLLVVGEAPGADEDRSGRGFVGDAGIKLRTLLSGSGLSEKDYWVANICRCRPPDNRKPKVQEIKACLPYLKSLIAEVQPKVILAVGGRTAAAVLCGPGTLTTLINAGEHANFRSADFCKSKYEEISGVMQAVPYVVPMPHTSPRVLNNPSWANTAKSQIAKAAELLAS